MIKLKTVESAEHLVQVRTLLQEYGDSRKHDPALVNFAEEINNLPGKYTPPAGNIILAYCNDELAGCVAVHKLDDDICEMKRLYVSPKYRGKGIGRSLVIAIIEQARMIGYARMRLDSIPSMKAAQALYESIGFYKIPDYRNNPNEDTKYYEIGLYKR